MANTDFPFILDRRRLLASVVAATTVSALPEGTRSTAALGDTVQSPPLTLEVEAPNVSAATARRLLEIARRNEIRQQAGLPLLPIVRELRRLTEQEKLEEFERFAVAHGEDAWDRVLKSRIEAEDKPNWMEGICLQNQVRELLWEQFRAARRVPRRKREFL